MADKTVLIGDDDISMVEMLRDLLEVEGIGLDETTPAQDLRARSTRSSPASKTCWLRNRTARGVAAHAEPPVHGA